MPSDFAKRASFALFFTLTSHPNSSTLLSIKDFTSSLIGLPISRLILAHLERPPPGRLPERIFETWGTSRLERNTLTVRISMRSRILPTNSLHKPFLSPSMPSMRMYMESVLQSRTAFLRTFHKEHGLVKTLSPCFLSSALQPSKRLPSCCRMPYSRSLATLASLSCDSPASSADVPSVGSSGVTKWKTNLASFGGSSSPLRSSAATRLASMVFPVPGPPQIQRSLDSLLSCHSLYSASSKIHFPVSS